MLWQSYIVDYKAWHSFLLSSCSLTAFKTVDRISVGCLDAWRLTCLQSFSVVSIVKLKLYDQVTFRVSDRSYQMFAISLNSSVFSCEPLLMFILFRVLLCTSRKCYYLLLLDQPLQREELVPAVKLHPRNHFHQEHIVKYYAALLTIWFQSLCD